MDYLTLRATCEEAQLAFETLLRKGLAEEVLKEPKRRVRLKMEYDLRTDQAAKSLDCVNSNDYTAFVSKSLKLVHVMRYGHPGVMIRLPGLNLKDKSRRAICTIILELLYE